MSLSLMNQFDTFHDEFDRLFHDLARNANVGVSALPSRKGNGQQLTSFTGVPFVPNVDLVEKEKEFVLNADLPGVKKEDVKLQVQNGVLSISGERKEGKKVCL